MLLGEPCSKCLALVQKLLHLGVRERDVLILNFVGYVVAEKMDGHLLICGLLELNLKPENINSQRSSACCIRQRQQLDRGSLPESPTYEEQSPQTAQITKQRKNA